MKKTIFLHIGLPKTGTTYLQCQIQTNRDKLRDNGIFVPQTGQLVGRDHNLLALALQPERWDQFPIPVSASLPSLWHDLLAEIDNCGCPTILITSEAFSWELKTPDQIKSVRDYLVNYDVKIVLCEREPYGFISSMYGHMLRTGRGPYSLESFVLEFPYYWSASSQKKRWGEFFGENNFIRLAYEELSGEFILHKFLNTLFPRHAILSETFNASPDINPNLSFSPRFLRFMEELSANQIDATPYVNLYSKVLSAIVPLERQILTPLEIEDAMKRCGMVIAPSNSPANKTLHQCDREEEKVPLLEQISNELIARTQELDEARQLLIERTERLESLTDQLASQTQSASETSCRIPFLGNVIKNILTAPFFSRKSIREELREIKCLLDKNINLVNVDEDRARTIEHVASENLKLTSITEERSRTIEYVENQIYFTVQHQVEQLQRLYVELMPVVLELNQRAAFNATSILELKTDYPVAVGSNDHINPDSTTEGAPRPTFFVQNCISVLGPDIKCLDLGAGAGGLVYEWAMNQVLAVGVDGSDFCRTNRVGYWPLLPNNMFTCDITKPFNFLSRDLQTLIDFDVITMWEVLEHIAECDLPSLFSNVKRHLGRHGYFIGSISLVEYVDSTGNPYHVTLKPRNWWKAKFLESDLVMLDTHLFDERLFCRGNGPHFQDFHNYEDNPKDGFWFVAQRVSNSDQAPI